MFALGASITSAWHTSNTATNTISGTSMAAPHVAGVAALFLQNNSNATSQEVYDAITEFSTKNIVSNSRTASNHLVYSLFDETNTGGGDGDDGNGDGDGEVGDNAPAIDTFNVNTRSSGPWNRAEVSWAVSDEDGDLDSIVIDLLHQNSVLDSVTINVNGSTASGENELRSRSNPDSVHLTVTDGKGNETSEIQSY